jgi:hypothetical protein
MKSPNRQRGYTSWKIGGKRASQRIEPNTKDERSISSAPKSVVLGLDDEVEERGKRMEGGWEIGSVSPGREEDNEDEDNLRDYQLETPIKRDEEAEEGEGDYGDERREGEGEGERFCQRSGLTEALSTDFAPFAGSGPPVTQTNDNLLKKSVSSPFFQEDSFHFSVSLRYVFRFVS